MNDSEKTNESGQDKEFRIIVNAREKIVTEKVLTYEKVVNLAFPSPDFGMTMFTVTYRKGDDKKPEGTLVQGESVHIKNGMIFNVTATNKS